MSLSHLIEEVNMFRNVLYFLVGGFVLVTIASSETIIPGGYVSGLWEAAGSPYLIEGEIAIYSDSTLNIEPGVDIIFQGHYKFIINGWLEAVGTEEDSIIFDTADPSDGWHGLRFDNSPDGSEIAYCKLTNGRATGDYPDKCGGAIYCESSIILISHCTVVGNTANGYGGGIFCDDYANPIISHCVVRDNWSAWMGGGIYLFDHTDALIENCQVLGNHAEMDAGGIYIGQFSYPTIQYCSISNNSATEAAGGIMCYRSGPVISNCVINGNHADDDGGGMHCYFNGAAYIINCTFYGNSSNAEGGGIYCAPFWQDPTLINCILWNNPPNQIGGNGNPSVTYCDIMGGYYGTGNIWQDPLMVNPNWGVFYLQWGSPCIDAGDPNSPLDPDSTRADMGAFYYDQSTTPVILAGFFADPLDMGVLLTWSTACEIECYGWIVQRNGEDVSPIIQGNGTTPEPHEYSYLDSVATGMYSYCIKQLDYSGSVSYSPLVTVSVGTMGIAAFCLHQNHPNPFNPSTVLSYKLPVASIVNLSIYDISGRLVAELVDGWRDAGVHEVTFDGSSLASGIYIYQLDIGSNSVSGKMVLMK
ncbi:hypothetical protein CEE37_06010 [candidate division LCP-89 bacterium B3_LCP]|uniref:Secretion system C-terminal sorting domain-containing protein n=1 Tax=candidate division LCP-89 bacterium B3_LCP TaxID=2012998 RepID=A0A532V2J8_UNCL8|nr:MAG: hypothetical protein CEE37_06010 [candidate division LCP-89 bacterium B3_LCP]